MKVMKNVVFCHMTSCILQNSAASIFPVEDGGTGSFRTADKHLSHYTSVPVDSDLCIVKCRAVSRQQLGKHIPVGTDRITHAATEELLDKGVSTMVRPEGL
jgi:hypothetical protein